MLETKQLVKIYKPKKGVPVKALDGVSLKFPDKGMVFLLGKSGSGKSTLLNVLGGLDRYDAGEIVIKGVSSKKFRQQHFDSYRNTYVGFIFQEYNILEEFSVGANIALALELQGKKATDEAINNILKEVDLEGYGARNPNELSGGQKQRVAIARALVKNPKIIMADEPSGALDSATGKQVFETLKKLSKEKLVIVVSHDRDFATEYADRIIELADGRVISDTTLCRSENAESDVSDGIVFEGETAKIPISYRLSEEDRIKINEYLENLEKGMKLEFVDKKSEKSFVPTVQEDIKTEDREPFKLIKSKLSLKHSFKIGSSGLKFKKFRLVMTVLLSCVAFIMFGLVDTFTSYDHISATASSIYDSGVRYAAVNRAKNLGDENAATWYSGGMKISDADIEKLSRETGVKFEGVLCPSDRAYFFNSNIGEENNTSSGYNLDTNFFGGIVETSEKYIKNFGYELVAGEMPDGAKNEIAISKFIFESFKKTGYREAQMVKFEGKEPFVQRGEKISITEYSDMLNKTLLIKGEEYKIVGIVDTKIDLARYKSLFEDEEKNSDTADVIVDYVLIAEIESELLYSYTGMMLVGEGFIDRFCEQNVVVSDIGAGYLYFDLVDSYEDLETAEKLTVGTSTDTAEVYHFSSNYFARFENIDKSKIIWLGEEKTELGDKDIIITADILKNWFGMGEMDEYGFINLDLEKFGDEISKLSNTAYYAHYYNYYDEIEFDEGGYSIVGVYDNTDNGGFGDNDFIVMNDRFFDKIFVDNDGRYDFALAVMPETVSEIKALTEYCYTDRDGQRYEFNNPASVELDTVDEVIVIVANALLYVGLFFAVFAAILLSNFIATSISYKKQEIGILRAIGSRGNDVFRIFFSEAFIIAMINFVLASVGTAFVTSMINTAIRDNIGLLITVFNFGLRQILFVFLVSVFVAFVASFLPVRKIASKRPIDAIRNR